ncbi:hypothetical protein [Paenibacillus sp. PAMC21692]|uniref:hypothetical protein n=1 Tax=Paenibacillus sp. PAMC21692 TaxID=2762320 RepID=UPI00164DE8CA|nr:hypothetical protein [Paenibacillus sp. PAMC21692]QNK57430.1 hypothetical protein H7F31_00035 [Paenibacillus sp. PAMC21692]
MVHKAKGNQVKPEGNVFTLKDLSLRPSASRHTSKPVSKKSVLTVVKHKNGTRVTIDQDVIEKIGSPNRVQIALNHVGVAIGFGFTGDDNYFPLRKSENKAIIYSSSLVTEMTETFELDFSNVSSVSFQNAEYLNIGSQIVAFVKMVRNEPASAGDSSNCATNPDDEETGGSELELKEIAKGDDDNSEFDADDEADGDDDDSEFDADDEADGDDDVSEFDADDETDAVDDDSEFNADDEADGDDDDSEFDADDETDAVDDDSEFDADDETDAVDDDSEFDADDETDAVDDDSEFDADGDSDSEDDDGDDSEKYQPLVLTRRRRSRS